ncbi:MAG: Hsp20/alpha crystallin family protein [Acidobacteria bacterium]|nr:Hsp20/alpha crystallin family protein [Acidobacteriota bacterium]
MNTTLVKPEFPLLRRLSRDLDSFFDRFGFDRPITLAAEFAWTPDLEVLEKGNEFIVKADVPGMKREDIKVELTDNELTISGERKMEKEEKEKGFYRTERSYGSFFRTIALPEGVKTKDAKAIVKDGVLEVKMPMAKIEATKRRLEIAA